MRLFIAIDFNELNDYLKDIQNHIDPSLASLKMISTFHLTLKFLGKVPDDQAEIIKERLREIKFERFSLTLEDIGVFPSENYINVIWLGVKPQDKVKELQKNIENVLKDFEFKKDFDFHPHLTLARVKFVKDKENFKKSLKEINVDKKTIEVKDFRLIKSTLKPLGPIYEEIEIFKAEF